MDEKEKNQKTVVAFIAGLLIGGLLVWVFGAAPESAPSDRQNADTNSAQTETDDTDTEVGTPAQGGGDSSSNSTSETPRIVVSGNGSISVSDQAAGVVVELGEIEYPTTDGWIVIHDDVAGELGNALGASRYSTEVGLLPATVELLRSTESGSTYHAVLYSENGDRVFDLDDDRPLTTSAGRMIEAVFTAN